MLSRTHQSSIAGRSASIRRMRRRSLTTRFYCRTNGCASILEIHPEGVENLVITQELQRGYRFHERVLRPTMVKVGPPPSATSTSPAADVAESTASEAETTGTTP